MKRKYYFYQFFSEFMPIYPLYALMFQNHGLSIFQISMLFTIWTVPCILLEIPSGVLADRWSRKKLMVIGSVLKTLGFGCWFFSTGFFLYAIGFICWGVSSACSSGSKEALLFDTLKEKGEEDQFEKVYGFGNFLSCISKVIACALGGLAANQVDMKLPLLCSILNAAITIGIVISFEEKNLFKNKKQEVGILRQMLEDTRFFRKKRDVLRVLCISLLLVGVCEVLDEYDQLIVSNLGFTLTFIGIWAAIRGVFEGVGSLVAAWVRSGFERVFHITKRHQMITIIGVVAVSFLGVSAYLHQSWSICLYAGYYFLIAICKIMTEDYLQQRIDEEGRSTIHSIVSLVLNLFGFLLYGILGVLFNGVGLFGGIVVLAVVMLFIIVAYSMVCKKLSIKKQ